MASLYFS